MNFIRIPVKRASSLATATCVLVFTASAETPETARQIAAGRMPERWVYESPYSVTDSVSSMWWKSFNDPVLDSLIATGRANNYDIAAAIKRMAVAKAQTGIARAGYYPTAGISAGWTKERASGMTTSHTAPATSDSYFNIGADVSWEIDVFGKVRAGVNEKKASWRASRAEYEGVMLSVSAEIATTYIDYRVAQTQLAIAKSHSESQLKIVKIAEARHETGLASALDVAQARTVYSSTLSTIPPLESQIHTLRNSLALLLAEYASELPASLDSAQVLPFCPAVPAAGVPGDLMRRRPDIIAAEQNLAAAAAALGLAKKEFLPTLSIRGNIGTASHRADNLFSKESLTYSIEPTLSWTLFSGFSRKYAVAEARAQMEELIVSYHSTVQTAVSEVDNAIYSYARSLETITALEEALAQSHRAYTKAVDLYKSGNSGFTNVADAQMSYLTYSNQLIAAKGTAITSLITLYKALGGGTDTAGTPVSYYE